MSNDNTESISAKLRRWADKSEEPVGRDTMSIKCIAEEETKTGCSGKDCHTCERELFRRIADEIDAEKRSVLRNCAYPLTEEVGKPLKGDEDFRSWLDRWYYEKPVDDNSEPVDLGQPIYDKARGEMEVSRVCYTKSGFYFNNSRDGSGRRKMKGITYAYGERVGRPKQQVLDAKGVPIEVRDKVYLVPGKHCDRFPLQGYRSGVEYTVIDNKNPEHKADGRICITGGDQIHGYPKPEQVTHREPDTQERINADALKDVYEYWGCTGTGCSQCPAFVDGKKPKERYGVIFCGDAMRLDLLRRQRELDGRDA